ncbi:MAG TPA: VanZ family protein [Acidobacteriaceae bacterium]|nr:VanZ family protein [Acidobacteriaceae bacterium]
MAASPIAFNSIRARTTFQPNRRRIQQQALDTRSLRTYWLPVLGALLFICFTSTTLMGGTNTGRVVAAVWKTFFGTSHIKTAWDINFIGRKVGHFFGYGIVGLIFRDAWHKTSSFFSLVAEKWLVPFAATLAVASTFIVASLDEYHQMFLPGRVGRVQDAFLDTAGAIFLNLIVAAVLLKNTRKDDRGVATTTCRTLSRAF